MPSAENVVEEMHDLYFILCTHKRLKIPNCQCSISVPPENLHIHFRNYVDLRQREITLSRLKNKWR